MQSSSLLMAVLLTGSAFIAQTAQSQTPPDNTRTNKVESNDPARIADGQSNDSADLELTRQIRRSLVSDDSLSTYAHNVKIVTAAGKVTLNGVVRSDQERAAVVTKASEIAGRAKVLDELKVAPAD